MYRQIISQSYSGHATPTLRRSSTAIMQWLFTPVDNSPLIIFRIVFGLLIFLESVGAIFTGWVYETFVEPSFTFSFIGFEWLQPLPGWGMYVYYTIMGMLGLMVMVGLYYRLSISAFTVMWWGAYLMQKSHYNNHYYLLILLCLLMICVPAHRYASLDVKRDSSIQSLTCLRWHLFIFIAQVAIVYTYAALAKLYPDWLAGKPIKIWFSAKASYPVIGPLLQEGWLQGLVVYGGIAFDLLIVPLLLFRRTRLFALGLSVGFHLFNELVFQIGIFPFLMIALSVFFFPPTTIRRLFFKSKPPVMEHLFALGGDRIIQKYPVIIGLSVYFALQVLLPLRHWLYPGNVHWTEEGHRMAWHMMLRSKSGSIYFRIVNATTNEEWLVYPHEYLTRSQLNAMATHPDMVWQFVQFLKKKYAADGVQPEIYAFSRVSLNGRARQALIDGNIDLAKIEWHPFRHSAWLLPMDE